MTTRGQDLCFTTPAKKLFRLLSHSLKNREAQIHETSGGIIPTLRTFQNGRFSRILCSGLWKRHLKVVLVAETSGVFGERWFCGVGCFPCIRQSGTELEAGCWLRGLECVIGAWRGSSLGLRICQLGSLGNLLWQFFKKGRIRPRRDCFYILTTRISDRVLSNKQSGPRQNEGLCSKNKRRHICKNLL